MALQDELRVVTGRRMRQIAHNAAEHLLERQLSSDAIELAALDGISIAKLAGWHPSGTSCRVTAVIDTGDGENASVMMGMLAGDWAALPTAAEFDAELDVAQLAARARRAR